MSVKEIDPRGALGRLTRAAFQRGKGVPLESDMDDSARLSQALNELDDLRRLLLESQERERELMEALKNAANSLQRIGDAVRKPTNWVDGDTLVFELAYEGVADIRAALSRAEGRKP